MDHYNVKRFALVLAVQAEIEGMKAENQICKERGMPISYNEGAFQQKAEELKNLAAAHNEQL